MHFEADAGIFTRGNDSGQVIQERRLRRAIRGRTAFSAFAFRLCQRYGLRGDDGFRRADPVRPAEHAEVAAGYDEADAERQRDGRNRKTTEGNMFLFRLGVFRQLFVHHRAQGRRGIDAGHAAVQGFGDQLFHVLFWLIHIVIHCRVLLPASASAGCTPCVTVWRRPSGSREAPGQSPRCSGRAGISSG